MISIDRIRIQGFRGIEFMQMALSPTCVLIGPNNSGKTSVLRAMQMALSESLPISHNDFHHTSDHDDTHRFTIDLRIVAMNEAGKRTKRFSDKWTKVFGQHISLDRHQREFFAAKKNVWIWHESWTDNLGKLQEITLRYEVRPDGVYKKQLGKDYKKIEGEELNNFRNAAHSYLNIIKSNLYS